MSDSTAVATRERGISIGKRARGIFDPGQMELIRSTVAKDCTIQELGMLLELCVRYELDPFAKEIWAAKMQNRVVIMVARDGFLQIANRSGEFLGMQGDVVHENDTFRKVSTEALPEHSYTQKDRGPIVAAWASVHREGRRSTYFYAELPEYMPQGRKLNEHSPWNFQVSAMILKCAEMMALRKAFSITGLVGEEEMSNQRLVNGAVTETEDIAQIEWGDEPTLAAWLPALFAAVNQERPGAWMPAKIRMRLRGKTDEEREKLAAGLAKNLVDVGAAVPQRLTLEELEERANAIEGEIVQDAVIVNEHDEPPADYVPSTEQDEIPFGEDAEESGASEG